MKAQSHLIWLAYCVRGTAVLISAMTASAPGATVWNGPLITYNQPSPDPTQAANQDRMTDRVWLTRANRLPMFNAKVESAYNYTTAPTDTEWAYGTLANYASLTYKPWAQWVGGGGAGGSPLTMVNQDVVLHLKTDDIYLSIKFSFWAAGGVGGYTYQRSTPSAVAPPPVLLTNASGANNQFAFDYNVSPGLSYVVERSSNLVNWVSVVTNVPTSSPAHFSESLLSSGSRFYRVGRMP